MNPKEYNFRETIVLDIETDERDNFVGIAVTDGPDVVYYFSVLNQQLIDRLEQCSIVGHNIKFDAKLLVKWGCKLRPEQLKADTMLMSYVMNTTKESHGLKELSKEYLKREYPSYKTIVGKGKAKRTLDKHPIEVVSAYCGADARCTWDLWTLFNSRLTPQQRRVLDDLDMPLMRLLFSMELKGIRVDREYLQLLETRYQEIVKTCELRLATKGLENPRSPKQVKEWLNRQGIEVENTNKATLQEYADEQEVSELLDYRMVFKLHSTYLVPLLEMSATDSHIYTNFNQVTYEQSEDQWKGIRTGRLSSSNPNLQNIPSRSDAARVIRRAFVPDPGYTLICADFEQIEYRLLAHFASDKLLIQAFLEGKDVHDETGKAIGGDRKLGKNVNFAAIYGAGPRKLAQMCKISEAKAAEFLDAYWQKLPRVKSWIEQVKKEAHQKKGVHTWYDRFIPLPGLDSYNDRERFHYERAAVNYIIQGSAAEILKMAMLRCDKAGYRPLLTVHDELLFNVLPDSAEKDKKLIGDIMASVANLSVPIIAKVGYGNNWDESK